MGDSDKYCDILMTLPFFSFVTLGFGEAQMENRVFGTAMHCSRDLGKFREVQVELVGGTGLLSPRRAL